ncbi:MAG: hypothetical protein LBS31_11655 [Candidatus Adiutrix sp.]|jgi:hypothetical protein|nr:hypothetical protein [Candidatus Adiutrix sp.]
MTLKMDMATKSFYDEFWPANVPHYDQTKEYMLLTIFVIMAVKESW